MFQIVLNGQKIRATEFKYPCLIHGKQGSGASQFTISLASDLLSLGKEVLFFSAFPAGKSSFISEIGSSISNTDIPESGNEKELLDTFDRIEDNSFVVIKNVETYSDDLLKKVASYANLVLSGDFDLSKYPETLPKAQSHIVFSPTILAEFPQHLQTLKKYEGFFSSKDVSGKVTLGPKES